MISRKDGKELLSRKEKYFQCCALPTDTHFALVEEFEKSMAQGLPKPARLYSRMTGPTYTDDLTRPIDLDLTDKGFQKSKSSGVSCKTTYQTILV